MAHSLHDLLSLDGRVALITGAANILGPEFAAALAEFGAQLALADINAERCEQVARAVGQEHSVTVKSLEADVANEQSVAEMVQSVLSEFGRLDILLCAAASKSGMSESLADYTLEDWNHDMSVNLTSMFLCAKHVVPHFVDQKRGNIINIASHYGLLGPNPSIYEGSSYIGQRMGTPSSYSASKGGVINLTRYLATTLAPHNIRANSIAPGGVFSGQNENFVERYSALVPLARMGNREELRGAVLFLASDASSYVTGHNLVVDGGLSAW